MPKYDGQGLPLGALGNQYAIVTGAATTLVTAVAHARLCRIVWTAGPTGVVVVWDNNTGVASGNQLWNGAAPAGNIALLDAPCNSGLTVVVPASTTVNVIFSA